MRGTAGLSRYMLVTLYCTAMRICAVFLSSRQRLVLSRTSGRPPGPPTFFPSTESLTRAVSSVCFRAGHLAGERLQIDASRPPGGLFPGREEKYAEFPDGLLTTPAHAPPGGSGGGRRGRRAAAGRQSSVAPRAVQSVVAGRAALSSSCALMIRAPSAQ